MQAQRLLPVFCISNAMRMIQGFGAHRGKVQEKRVTYASLDRCISPLYFSSSSDTMLRPFP